MIQSLLKKYILPKEVDFLKALSIQAQSVKKLIYDLKDCFVLNDMQKCSIIIEDEEYMKELRKKNISQLLNTFITPFDRESIYRQVTQLDAISTSVLHFVKDMKVYEIKNTKNDYEELIGILCEHAKLLYEGIDYITIDAEKVVNTVQNIRNNHDSFMDVYRKKILNLSKENEIHQMFLKQELLSQLKEISRHFEASANSLEDIVMKIS